ncbi:MAG: hypothetical protein EG825_14770 [Rhodocyclaceae bacterium]|nr:hypothetical protein [Rhodocyclaceae bacterium]
MEINDTRKNMKETEKHKGGVWHQGDKEFYYHWYSGLIHEKQTNYDSAQHYYHKALAVRRHEMGTYYVKYPLGRVLFLSGDTLNGRKYINQYIAEVTYEINHPDEQEWSMIAETVKAYRHEIKEAIYFLERRKANNVTNQ